MKSCHFCWHTKFLGGLCEEVVVRSCVKSVWCDVMRSARSSRDTSPTLVSVVPASLPAPLRYTALSTVAIDTVTATPPGHTHTHYQGSMPYSKRSPIYQFPYGSSSLRLQFTACVWWQRDGRILIFDIKSAVMFNVYVQIMKHYVTSELL